MRRAPGRIPAALSVALGMAVMTSGGCGDPDKPGPQPGARSATASGRASARPMGPNSSHPSPGSSAKPGTSATPSAGPASGEAPLVVRELAKVEQLIGDEDKQLRKPTRGRSGKRFGVDGTDLGYPFEGGDGRLIFLFGDTIGTEGQQGSDAIGFTTITDPDPGVALDFYARPDGKFLPFRPTNKDGKPERLKGFEVPVGGIRLPAGTFVAYKTNHAGDEDGSKDGGPEVEPTDITRLASFDEKTGEAKDLCEISRQPAGRFQKLWWHTVELDPDASPDPSVKSHDWVLMYGTGRHRDSHVYLAVVPASGLPTCKGFRYFTGLAGSRPMWSEKEADANPVFDDPEAAVGEVSVTWAKPTSRWLALYDNKDHGHRKILARDADKPWGPWTPPVVVVDAETTGNGVFIHDPKKTPSDGLAGPMIGKNKDHPEDARGATYAPFIVERWTKDAGDAMVLYFTLSVWNPYVVELMKVKFAKR